MSESTNRHDAVKMGVLITKLCEHFEVEIQTMDIQKHQRKPLNKSTKKRAAGQLRNHPPSNQEEIEGADTVGHDGQPSSQEEQAQEENAPQEQVPRKRRRENEETVQFGMDVIMERFDQVGEFMKNEFQGIRSE